MATSAFLTSAFPEADRPQPSVFEILAQQGLTDTLQPAALKLLTVLSQTLVENNFAVIGKFGEKYKEEILLVANGVLQLHYLKVYNASFTEQFYGLERVSRNSYSDKKAKNLAWLEVVIAPYLKKKLSSLFEKCREDLADGIRSSNSLKECSKQLYVRVYPYFHLLSTSLDFCKKSLQKSTQHNILSLLLGYYLVNVTPERFREQSAKLDSAIRGSGGWRGLGLSSISSFAKVVTFSLETGSFFLQFLDWWYNREDTQSPTFSYEAIPPPPPLTSDVIPDMCPVCRRPLGGGDTLAPVSGLVFCYPCIVTQVRKNGKCPVTGLPLMEEDLIRIFWPEK